MKEICTILEEHKETLADIDFKVSYEKENDKEQLCAILETVPITVWEALGFQQVRKVTVYDYLPYIGDFGLKIDIYMADKTHSIVSASPQNPYFALASVYKPYHDFCTEKLRTMLAHLESHINYVETEDLTKKPEYRLRRVLHRDIGCKQYDVYFERWNLEDDLIRYCIQNEITFPDEILRKKKELVLSIFCEQFNRSREIEYFDRNEWCEIQRYYEAYRKKESSFVDFADQFLLNEASIFELWKRADGDVKHLENMMTAKAWKLTMMISEHLLYQQVCAKALGQDISIYYIQGMLEGYVFSFLECLMDFVSTPDIMHKVGNRKNLTDQYIDYLIANKERYVNELAVPAEKLEIEVDEWYGGFKAYIPQYRISEIADSKEAAIELARNAYKKGQSRWILWRINEEYPGYADV